MSGRIITLQGDRGSRFLMVGLPRTRYSRKLALCSARIRYEHRQSWLIVGAFITALVILTLWSC